MGLKVVGMGLLALLLCACSNPPRQPAPAAREPSASAAAVTGSAAAPAANATTPEVDATYIKAGYKATMFKGQVYYCRMEDVTGTQFKRKVCLDEAHMRDEQRKNREMQDSIMRQRTNPACTPMPTCAG